MDRNKEKEVAGLNGSLRLATRAVGSAALLALGLFAVPAWATCEFAAPTVRTDTSDNGWADGADKDSGDLVFVLGDGTAVTMPAVADGGTPAVLGGGCAGEGDVEVTLWQGTTQVKVATGDTNVLELLELMDGGDGASPVGSRVTVDTETDQNTLISDGTASLNYTPTSTGTAGFHNAAPVAFQLRAEKAFSGGDVATFDFTVTIKPAALGTPPTAVELYSETATSIYVEWTGDSNDSDTSDVDPTVHAADTSATHYVIGYTYQPAGVAGGMTPKPEMGMKTVMDTATGITPTQGAAVDPRQYTTLTGLKANTSYTITVMGVRGDGYARSESAEVTTAAGGEDLEIMTRDAYHNPRLVTDDDTHMHYKISVGETVDLQVKDLIYIGLAGVAADPDMSGDPIDPTDNPALSNARGRGSADAADADPLPTFTFAVAGGNTDGLRVEYLNDGDTDNADDLVRLTGLKKGGAREVTITATSMDTRSMPAKMTTLTGKMRVEVLENFDPKFALTEANVNWNVGPDGDPLEFEIDVMGDFVTDQIADANENAGDCSDDENASNDANCDHKLTFTMSFSRWFEIDEDTGLITVKEKPETQTAAQYLEPVKEGDQYELKVTATDQSGGNDNMTIFVDVVEEENDKPKKRSLATDIWLQPLTEAKGGGFREAQVRSKFSDEEDDDLCFEIRDMDLADSDGETLADASLGGASSCQNDTLTITMRLPSTDPQDEDAFALLGKYGKETVTVDVGAYERGSTPKVITDGTVTVSVHLVYGQNEGPLIRSVAKVTGGSTYVTSGGHEIDEGGDIRLTFTADDAQPTGDELCWSSQRNCRPCTGDPKESSTRDGLRTIERRTSNSVLNGVSHEWNLIIRGTETNVFTQESTQVTDYERYDGVYTVRLCATDLAGETHRMSFEVKLKDVEEAPKLKDIASLYMVVGDDSSDVDLTKYASDGDGKDDIESYDADCIISCRGALTFQVQDGVVRITPSSTQLGESDVNDTVEVEIEASVTDSTGKSAYTTFEVTVKDRNEAPQFDGGLAAVSYTVPENSGVGTAVGEPLSISDMDSADRLSVKVLGSDNFSARIVKTSPPDAEEDEITYGVQIQVAKAGLDFESARNAFDINVQIQDNYGGRDSIDAHISLTDKNEAPELIGEADDIPDMVILDGITRCVLDASEHFKDQDNRDQQAGLLIDATSTRPSDVVVSIVDNNDVCITGKNVGTGASRIKVTATDREDLQVSKTFRVSVEENMPPMVVDEGIPDTSTQEGGNTGDIDLSMYFDDGDMLYEENLTYSFTMDDPGDVATGALVGDQTMLRIYGDTKGLVDVTVTATDEKGQSVSDMFEVQVIRNYPPMADEDAFARVEQYIGKEYDPIDATEVFTDEGDELEYSITTSNPDVATAAIKYDDMDLPWIIIHLHSPGTVEVTMMATDSAAQMASASFSVIVHPRNDPPTVAMPIDDVELIELRSYNIELEGVFSDDHDAIELLVVNEDETIADVVHRMSANMIRAYGNEPGTTTVAVTATDDIGQSVVDTFEVVVVPNHPPMVANELGTQELFVYRSIEVDIIEVFSDENEDPLVLTAESANEDIATVGLDGTTLTITGVTVDSTTVSLTATDPGELTVQHLFEVDVLSDSPFVVEGNEIADQMLTVVDPVTVSFADTFGDPEDDELTFMAVSDNEDVATVMIDGTDITITGVMVGEAEVTLTATDPYDNSASVSFGVEVINAVAMVVTEIPDQTMTVVDPVMISIADTFEDPDGDELMYTAMSSNEAAATVMLDGTDLTITGVKVGMTTITVTGTDPGDLSAMTSFEVVVENAMSMVVTEIPDQTMTVVDPVMISIADTFEDPDGDELMYTAMSSNEDAATVMLDGTDLTITAVKVGMTTVGVTATDPAGLSAMTSFKVEVENAMPMLVSEIADQTMTVVEPVMISIADTFMDPDGDELMYTAMSSNEDAATVMLDGTDLTITAVKVGMTTITLKAMDPDGLYAMDEFEVEVENAAPMLVSEIDDQKLTVVEPITISVADNFMDPDGDPLKFSATSSNEAAATVNVSGSYITITAVKVGFTMVTVTAMDPDGLYAMDEFEVEVENAAPMLVSEIDDQMLTVVDPITVSVADNFMDPDGDPLKFSASSSNEAAATVSVSGSDITITAVKVGFTTVTVTAMDPDGLYAMDEFEVEVENAAPMLVNEIADQNMTVVDPVMISIADTFMDPDGDELMYTAMSSNEDAATVSLDGTDMTITAVKVGMTTITVMAMDPGGLYAMDTFEVEVENATPMLVSEIDDQKLTVVEPITVSVADNFMDPDGDPLKFSATSSNEAAATLRVDGSDITITAVKVGFTIVTVTATDPDGLYAMDTFEVEVENAAPMMIGTIDDQVVTRGEPITISIAAVFSDPDGDTLTNSADSADGSIASVSVSGEDITIDGLAPGTTTITVTASDPDGLSASGTFMVTVETIPEAVGTIADITIQIGGNAAEMNIAQYFEDDDGDTLAYTVATSGNAATASLSGSDLTVSPFTRGSSTITLTASDPKGRSATQSFTATVSDSELRAVAEMALAHHGRAVLSSVSAVLGARLESERIDTGLSFGRFAEYLPMNEGIVQREDSPTAIMRSMQSTPYPQANISTYGMNWGSVDTMQSPIGSPSASLPSLDTLFNPLRSKNFSKTLNGNGGIGSWSVWGGFDAQSFEGEGYSGDAASLFLGVDVQSHICWLFGVSIASNTGESDYTWGSATQTLETSLTTILPYVRYQPTDGKSSYWGVLGSGSGEAESTVINAANQTSDLSLNLGLAGMRYEIGERGNFNLAFRGDIGFAGIETASGSGAIDSLAADVNRIRAGIEASLSVDPGNGGSVVPFGELAVRNDGGDGVTGSGLEVAGGVRFSQDSFSLEARGRLTAAHGGEEFSEQGISVVAAFRPSQDGTGLSMTVSPRWGSTSSGRGKDLVWNETTMIGVSSVLPETNVLRSAYGKSIDTSLGYGFQMSNGRFLLTPYVNTSSSSSDVKSTLIGAELIQVIQAPRLVNLNLVFEQTEDDYGSEKQIGLNVRILF